MMKQAMLVVVVAVAMVAAMGMPGEAVDCSEVNPCLAPCIPYLTGSGPAPSSGCCDGVRKLKGLAPTAADRQGACECIKAAAAHYPNINQDAAASLAQKCGVDFHVPISKTIDCKTIN